MIWQKEQSNNLFEQGGASLLYSGTLEHMVNKEEKQVV